MPLQIRAMTESDLPAARRLWSETEGVELAEGDSVEELTRYLRRNPDMSAVALDGDRLIGAVLAGHDGRRGFVYHLSVSRDHRRSGVGKALVERVLAAFKMAGMRRVLLLVAADNGGGEKFWRQQGWEAMEFARPMGIDL
jgi:N-acetylglutamate synthase